MITTYQFTIIVSAPALPVVCIYFNVLTLQALSYKIGHLKFQELRKKAEIELGMLCFFNDINIATFFENISAIQH